MKPPPISFATDIQLRDQEFARKLARRRQLLLRWSLPVVILAALVSLKFLSATGLNLVGTAAYDRANFTTAANRYVNTQTLNVVQPWKAFYNEGTAHYSAGKFFTATQRFEIALQQVPQTPQEEPRGEEECLVRVNYSLALEGLGAEALAVGDPASSEDFYSQALEMLADCASSGNGGQTAEEAEERQSEGQQEAQEQQEEPGEGDPEEGEGDPEEGDPEEGEAEEDPQQQELEERNQRANQGEAEDDPENPGIGDGSGQNW